MAARQALFARAFIAAVVPSTYSRSWQYSNTFEPFRHLLQPMLKTQWDVPSLTRLGISSMLAGIWESILRAVPKKKTSHRKTRQRFMAGKGLMDVTALNKCSACGNVKKAHLLCPFCVGGGFKADTLTSHDTNGYALEIRNLWKKERSDLKHESKADSRTSDRRPD